MIWTRQDSLSKGQRHIIYLASKWTISASDIVDGHLRKLIDICTENQCHLKFGQIEGSSQGYSVTEFVVRVPSGVDFSKVTEQTCNQMSLTEWRDVSEDHYSAILRLSFQDTHPLGFTVDKGEIFEGLWVLGRGNDKRRAKLGTDNKHQNKRALINGAFVLALWPRQQQPIRPESGGVLPGV